MEIIVGIIKQVMVVKKNEDKDMDINFNDVNIRIMWCAAWNQAATIFSGNKDASITGIESLARKLFAGMLVPYQKKEITSQKAEHKEEAILDIANEEEIEK